MDYQKGISPIIEQQRNQLTDKGWIEFFDNHQTIIQKIDQQLISDVEDFYIFPKPEDVFRAFLVTPLHSTKVIIVGQDPYHNHDQAHGLAFSVNTDYPYAAPPSLKRILKEVNDCGYTTTQTDLTKWAKQGVLLINTALTVRGHHANSHKKIWQPFTEALFKFIESKLDKVVMMMWGLQAQSYSIKKFHALTAPHPSPMAGNAFMGNQHFLLANKQLTAWRMPAIDWCL
jgi:uracil-DNA glycosylase